MHPLVVELRKEIRLVAFERDAAQRQVFEAERRAAIAEKSARDAWAFAKTVMQTTHRPIATSCEG